MANIADTEYKITGSTNAVYDLWSKLEKLSVNEKEVPLYQLAELYGIDYEAKGICVRGCIYWADFERDEKNEYCLISFDTGTAWDACEDLFDEINHCLNDGLSISYRVFECGEGLHYVHDEGSFFTEEVAVCSSGKPFEDACYDVYETIGDAVREWCRRMSVDQGSRSDKEMMDYINDYEYEDDCTYFNIYAFVFV